MKNNYLTIIIFTLIVAGILLKPYLFPSEEEKIKAQITELAQEFHFQSKLNVQSLLIRINSITKYFAEDVEIQAIDGDRKYTQLGWKTIKDNLLLGSQLVHNLKLDLSFHQMIFQIPSASVRFLVTAVGADQEQNRFRESAEIELTMNKSGGKWIIERIIIERTTPE